METAAEWKAWRIAHHMSQKSFALALGLAPNGGGTKTIWNIENGRHKPSYMTQARFEALKERYGRSRIQMSA
jgi:transcriptional regulator with XRE-family HTH domain